MKRMINSHFTVYLLSIIIITLIIYSYDISIKNNDLKKKIAEINSKFVQNDTLELFRLIMIEETKLNRVKPDSVKVEIIKYPFFQYVTFKDTTNELFIFDDIVKPICPVDGYLNVLDFRLKDDSTAFIEYTIANGNQGAIWYKKKNNKWEVTRYLHSE
ncbi:MAG: hypothetical protein A2X64_10830 [Ignavibacteria bacterium GWF2_33_9]|nr:MAG: hypothetical protein A2X64_10830 [Ignavibacteria bacterium GWF2_33_9]